MADKILIENEFSLPTCLVVFFIEGLLLGIVYDFFRLNRILRKSENNSHIDLEKHKFLNKYKIKLNFFKKHSKLDTALTLVEDTAFISFDSIVYIITNFILNDGQIRIIYIFLLILGFVTYYFTLGKISIKILDDIYLFLSSFINFIIISVVEIIKKISLKIKGRNR